MILLPFNISAFKNKEQALKYKTLLTADINLWLNKGMERLQKILFNQVRKSEFKTVGDDVI